MKSQVNLNNIIYVGFNQYGCKNVNGYLGFNSARHLNIAPFKLEKYNPHKDVLPGTFKYVQISKTKDGLDNGQIVLQIILDENFNVLQTKCLNSENLLVEDLFDDYKLSGIYAGVYKNYKKEITTLDEINVYLLIKHAAYKLNSITIKDSINEQSEWQYAYDFCLAHLERFGVEQKFDLTTNRMKETESFNAWYQWWDDYFNIIESDFNLFKKFAECRKTNKDLSMFRPTGSFTDYMKKKPIITKKIS